MEKIISFLWSGLFNSSKIAFAFSKEYIPFAVLIILGLIILLIKEKEKTKQKEIEEKEKTKRLKKEEQELTERTRIITSGSTDQLQILLNILSEMNPSMPPEEIQKLGNDNILLFNEILKDKTKAITSKSYENIIVPPEKEKQEENDKCNNEKNNIEDSEVALMKTAVNELLNLINSKKNEE